MPRRRALTVLTVAAALLVPAAPASAKVRHVWVAAVPTSFNIMPNGKNAIEGGRFDASQTVFPTVIYRRYTKGWRRPLRNSRREHVDHDQIPGPLIKARVGDRILVHFKNKDTLYRRGHSMHFHGVSYKPDSDGGFLPGVSGRGGAVRPGRSWTYRL